MKVILDGVTYDVAYILDNITCLMADCRNNIITVTSESNFYHKRYKTVYIFTTDKTILWKSDSQYKLVPKSDGFYHEFGKIYSW